MSVQMTFRAGVLLSFCLAMIGAARAETPLERGAYLVNTIMTCNNCHTPMGPSGPLMDKALSGGLTFDTPGFKVTAPNITPDKETGIGSWSDADLKKTLRTGVAPNGVMLAPVMPTDFYGVISERDMDAIVAYLHTVAPVQNQVPPPVYHRDFGHEVFPGSEQPIDDEGGTDPIKRGFYLATIGHCMECHTPMERGKHQWADRMGAGAQEFRGPWGVSVSRNITSDPAHGVGAWSDAELMRAITQGISRDGSKLNGPMGYGFYARMRDEDLAAVIAWVRTLPPKS